MSILKNKKAVIFSSLLTLLPILVGLVLWDRLPETMATHWSLDGQVDGYSSLPFAVFVPPLLMLAGQWMCIYFTAKDPGNKDRNVKPLTLVLWIIPVLSNLSCGIMYALALGRQVSVELIMSIALGLMFAAIGNYLPKCKMNYTMGIKLPWTYTSQANWTATHRFGGRLWVVGGLIIACSGLLPGKIGIPVMLISFLALAVAPVLYSYLFYRRQKANGEPLTPFPKIITKTGKYTAIFLILLFLGVGILMFTGDIAVSFGKTAFTVEADFYDDLTVDYAAIQTMEYREGNVDCVRVGGFGSFRLLMGFFSNQEFGNHTRYTYYKPEACIVLTVGERVLVLSGKTAAETRAIYDTLLTKIN